MAGKFGSSQSSPRDAYPARHPTTGAGPSGSGQKRSSKRGIPVILSGLVTIGLCVGVACGASAAYFIISGDESGNNSVDTYLEQEEDPETSGNLQADPWDDGSGESGEASSEPAQSALPLRIAQWQDPILKGQWAEYYWDLENPNDFAVPYEVTFTYRDSSGMFLQQETLKPCDVRSVEQFDKMILAPPEHMVIRDLVPQSWGDVEVEASVDFAKDCGDTIWGWHWDPNVQFVWQDMTYTSEPKALLELPIKASETADSMGIVEVVWYDDGGDDDASTVRMIGITNVSTGNTNAIPPGETMKLHIEGPSNVSGYEIDFLGLSK